MTFGCFVERNMNCLKWRIQLDNDTEYLSAISFIVLSFSALFLRAIAKCVGTETEIGSTDYLFALLQSVWFDRRSCLRISIVTALYWPKLFTTIIIHHCVSWTTLQYVQWINCIILSSNFVFFSLFRTWKNMQVEGNATNNMIFRSQHLQIQLDWRWWTPIKMLILSSACWQSNAITNA